MSHIQELDLYRDLYEIQLSGIYCSNFHPVEALDVKSSYQAYRDQDEG